MTATESRGRRKMLVRPRSSFSLFMRLFSCSCGFLLAHAAFWWRRQLLKEWSDDNDPHIKVVHLFMLETMVAFVWVSKMTLHVLCRWKGDQMVLFEFWVPKRSLGSKRTWSTLTVIMFLARFWTVDPVAGFVESAKASVLAEMLIRSSKIDLFLALKRQRY